MSSYNHVTLLGRMTAAPELKTTNNGKSVLNFRMAVDNPYNRNDEGHPQADFFGVTVWDRVAENLAKYGEKGKLVLVDGRLQTREYEDRDGNRRQVTEINAQEVRFVGSPKREESDIEDVPMTSNATKAPRQTTFKSGSRKAVPQKPGATAVMDREEDDLDDLPF